MTEVIIASKTLHVGHLIGHMSNSGGIIKLTDFVGIRVVGIAENFRQLQVVMSDNGEPIRSQQWIKTKEVARKKKLRESDVVMTDKVREEEVL